MFSRQGRALHPLAPRPGLARRGPPLADDFLNVLACQLTASSPCIPNRSAVVAEIATLLDNIGTANVPEDVLYSYLTAALEGSAVVVNPMDVRALVEGNKPPSKLVSDMQKHLADRKLVVFPIHVQQPEHFGALVVVNTTDGLKSLFVDTCPKLNVTGSSATYSAPSAANAIVVAFGYPPITDLGVARQKANDCGPGVICIVQVLALNTANTPRGEPPSPRLLEYAAREQTPADYAKARTILTDCAKSALCELPSAPLVALGQPAPSASCASSGSAPPMRTVQPQPPVPEHVPLRPSVAAAAPRAATAAVAAPRPDAPLAAAATPMPMPGSSSQALRLAAAARRQASALPAPALSPSTRTPSPAGAADSAALASAAARAPGNSTPPSLPSLQLPLPTPALSRPCAQPQAKQQPSQPQPTQPQTQRQATLQPQGTWQPQLEAPVQPPPQQQPPAPAQLLAQVEQLQQQPQQPQLPQQQPQQPQQQPQQQQQQPPPNPKLE